MKKYMFAGMREATRLVRTGQLLEATTLIQRTLRGAPNTAVDPKVDVTSAATDSTTTRPASPSPIALPQSRYVPEPEPDETPQQGYSAPETYPENPKSGQFLWDSYTNPAGTLTYKLYIPSGFDGQALPLVVMLHGCIQDPDDFAAGTRMNQLAEEQPCFVVYPAQPVTSNQSRCWHWFESAHQYRHQGEPSLIAGITRQIMTHYPIDSRRVYVAGLSAGGAMAVVMGITYPDLYAAIGVHSGVAYAIANDLPSAFVVMQQAGEAAIPKQNNDTYRRIVPVIVFHGDGDTTVHPGNGDQVIAQWTMLHAGGNPSKEIPMQLQPTVQQGQMPAGHGYRRTLYYDSNGLNVMEQWLIHGADHAWSGGSSEGSFTDPRGPDASREMLRFFMAHPQPETTQ